MEQDARLIDRFQQGDAEAFERLFHRHAGRIDGFSDRMCRHLQDAEDVLQETFLAAFKGLKGFRKKARLTTWLYKIASGFCLKKRRRKKHEPERLLPLDSLMPGAQRPEGSLRVTD